MKFACFLWITLIFGGTAAEPRFQLRSLIQNDGTLLHVRLDTETGKMWRLERVLKNRIEISLQGKLAARELERTRIDVNSLESFTLAEVLQTLNGILAETGNDDLPRLVFAIPVKNPDIDPAKAREQLVPPAQPFGEAPQGIDPTTGLPIHPPSHVQPPPFPGGAGGGSAIPGFPPNAIPGNPNAPPIQIDPLSGRPWFRPPVPRPPLWQPPRRKEDVTLFRIRNWGQPMRETSVQQVLAHVLNCADSPLRCVVDEKTVYFAPESSVITLGRTFSQPQYAEQWLEIRDDSPIQPK
jgi:hypothetical protein